MQYGKGSVFLHSEEWIWSYTSSFSKRQRLQSSFLPSLVLEKKRRSLHARPQNTCAQHTMHTASLPHRDEDCNNIFSSFSNLRPDSTYLDRGGDFFPCGFFPRSLYRAVTLFTWCNGWPMVLVTRAHSLFKLEFTGGVRIINPPLSQFVHMYKSGVMSKSGVHPVYL